MLQLNILSSSYELFVLGEMLTVFYFCMFFQRKAQFTCTAIFLLWGLVVHLLIPPFVFMYYEGWSYVEGFYFSFVTLTTIGFGDLVTGNVGHYLSSFFVHNVRSFLVFVHNFISLHNKATLKKADSVSPSYSFSVLGVIAVLNVISGSYKISVLLLVKSIAYMHIGKTKLLYNLMQAIQTKDVCNVLFATVKI